MAKSKIEWTNTTWNVITGCTKVSPGCKNCYAETMFNRLSQMDFPNNVYKGRKFTDVETHPKKITEVLHWKKPRMIFVNSMSDLFHEDVPFEFIDDVIDIVSSCSQHIFQVLTKRPGRMLEYFDKTYVLGGGDFLSNLWLGVSVENQEQADKRIPLLLQTPAAVRWISAEPLLENINIEGYLTMQLSEAYNPNAKLDWVVVGGESGPKKRPFDCDWARTIRDVCKDYKIPFFMKQVDKVRPIPKDLMIREYPK